MPVSRALQVALMVLYIGESEVGICYIPAHPATQPSDSLVSNSQYAVRLCTRQS